VTKKETLLIVEDDLGIQSQLKWSFDDFKVIVASDRKDALSKLKRHEPKVVTLDMGLPPDPGGTTEGLATLAEMMSFSPKTKVIVVTGNDDRASAVKAIAIGAYDFYLKPIDSDILALIVKRAFQVRSLEDENQRLSDRKENAPLAGLIANSPQMLKICRTIEKIAPANVTTLLLGESGTGKEVLAKAIHHLSPRNNARFVAINCAAIPDNLLESELFGYEKGAFTGANKQTLGKIEVANGGTLFLDEIGDLPMPLQAKLLRFLQERIIERVGGRKEIPVDVRVVCATHRGLPDMIKDGSFREDLYYRLSEITVQIPSVREREGDAVLLARMLLDKYAKEQNKKTPVFSKEALLAIENHAWPGNVRELENKVKRALILLEGHQISAEDLELTVDQDAIDNEAPLTLREVRDSADRKAVTRAMAYAGSNMTKTAELLGVSRPTLYDMIKKLDIQW